METNKQYLSVEDLSLKLNCTPQYTRKLIRDGKLPAEQVGKTWVINPNILSDNETMFRLSKDIPDQVRKDSVIPDIVALSFFSGAMGLDYGIEKAGIHPLLTSEIEPNARKTILLNRPNIGLIGDINNYSASEIRKFAQMAGEENLTEEDIKYGLSYGRSVIVEYLA